MVFIPSNHNRYQTILKLNKKKKERIFCRKFNNNFISKNFSIIEDDETYIKYNHQKIPDAVYYISKFRGEADKKFKYTRHDKFSKKALI